MTKSEKIAKKILLDAYWSSAGWKTDDERNAIPSEDIEFAKAHGFMFDSVVWNHQSLLDGLLGLISDISHQFVVDKFVASLSSRRLDIRSGLGSYAVFHKLQKHDPINDHSHDCSHCSAPLQDSERDINVLSFERHKWGGVRHNRPEYAYHDLSCLKRTDYAAPSEKDVDILKDILAVIKNVPESCTAAELQKHLAPVIKSNKAERDSLIGILGFCGIVETLEHPGYKYKYLSQSEIELPSRRYIDMAYPACWWSGADGLNWDNVVHYFGHLL